MSLNAGSSFQCYLKFFLVIEFAAAIEFFSAFQILMEGKNIGGLSASAHFNNFFLKGWTVLPKTKVLDMILFVGYCSDLLQVLIVVLKQQKWEIQFQRHS